MRFIKLNTVLFLVLFYFAIFSLLFVFIFPPFEGPDENLHLQYINYFSKYSSLPNQYEGYKNKQFFVGQGHQHPLYYIFTGVLNKALNEDNSIDIKKIPDTVIVKDEKKTSYVPYYKIFGRDIFVTSKDETSFYFFRILSVLFALINIYFIYKLSEIFFSYGKWRFLPVMFAASLPQFIFISSVINNDNLANLFSTLCIYLTFKIVKEGTSIKNFIFLGISIGVGILTKKTILFTVPSILVIILFLYYKHKDINFIKYFFISLIISFVICGWVFIRNYFTYGDLMGSQMEILTMPQFYDEKSFFSLYFIKPFLPGLFQSFVGLFAWMNIPIPKGMYIIYFLIIIVMIIGTVIYLIKSKFKDVKIWFSLIFIFVCFFGIIFFNLTFTQYQGRYLFPVLSLLSVIFIFGLEKLILLIKNKLTINIIICLVVIIFFVADILSIFVVLKFYSIF